MMLFDETEFVTSLAVLNPSAGGIAVTVRARDSLGFEIGSFVLNLGPRQRQALVIRDRPEMSRIRGKRGVLEISSIGGPVSVLGLRFNQLAFTSILPVEM
jgi:hypothetical protein